MLKCMIGNYHAFQEVETGKVYLRTEKLKNWSDHLKINNTESEILICETRDIFKT